MRRWKLLQQWKTKKSLEWSEIPPNLATAEGECCTKNAV